MRKNRKIRVFVAGHKGMLGRQIFSELKKIKNIEITVKNRSELDLLDQSKVLSFFKIKKFDHVYICAAKVGGIIANKKYPAEFIYENIMIQSNLIHSSYLTNVKRLLFIGSTCIYPKFANQPLREEYLLTSKLEESNEPYALSKICGVKMIESYNKQYGCDFRSVMPPNMYGVGDNFDPETSHVISGLIFKLHNAKIKNHKIVNLWGTGKPVREFLYSEDAAKICTKIMKISKIKYRKILKNNSMMNIGTGKGITVRDLSKKISKVVSYNGKIKFDTNFPDGHPKKVANIKYQKALNIKSQISLDDGIKKTYQHFLNKLKKDII